MTAYCPENWAFYSARVVVGSKFACNISIKSLLTAQTSGTVQVAFGDTTAIETISVSSTSNIAWVQANHSYSNEGSYTIRVTFIEPGGGSKSVTFDLYSYPGLSNFRLISKKKLFLTKLNLIFKGCLVYWHGLGW
jgi:hypothetical protein